MPDRFLDADIGNVIVEQSIALLGNKSICLRFIDDLKGRSHVRLENMFPRELETALVNHHQYEYENLLPMTLACMKAAKKLTFEYLEDQRGLGWWGSNENQRFYDELDAGDNPWNWIQVIPALSREVQEATGYDHAVKYESSILRALYPECVKMERLPDSDEWFIQSAAEGSEELGQK